MSVHLSVLDPDGRREVVVDRTLIVGRASDCDVRIKDRRMSRHHASIRPVSGGLEVRDLGSRHGVLVNGRRVSRARLQPYDELRFGSMDVRCRLPRGRSERHAGREPASPSDVMDATLKQARAAVDRVAISPPRPGADRRERGPSVAARVVGQPTPEKSRVSPGRWILGWRLRLVAAGCGCALVGAISVRAWTLLVPGTASGGGLAVLALLLSAVAILWPLSKRLLTRCLAPYEDFASDASMALKNGRAPAVPPGVPALDRLAELFAYCLSMRGQDRWHEAESDLDQRQPSTPDASLAGISSGRRRRGGAQSVKLTFDHNWRVAAVSGDAALLGGAPRSLTRAHLLDVLPADAALAAGVMALIADLGDEAGESRRQILTTDRRLVDLQAVRQGNRIEVSIASGDEEVA